MRKIILASKSKARQKLLRQIGLKFRVSELRVREKRVLKKKCNDLVIENALRKALNAAKKLKSGIVIGVDTVVLVNGKIIGKPRSMKDAFKTLKLLSRRPQWVYSGLAVIDIDNNVTSKACEKTKVYMRTLNDAEIKAYLKRASTLDKAGSFDIQGLGGMFVDRIEGCFYNVVGLPLAKLARMLKKSDVDIFHYVH